MLHFIYCYAACHCAECHYAEYRYAECRCALLEQSLFKEAQANARTVTIAWVWAANFAKVKEQF